MFAFLLELFLYSGQYGMFYFLMMAIHSGFLIAFTESFHWVLLMVLIGQCILLSRYGSIPRWRFFLSFLVPVVYTGIQFIRSPTGIWDMGHVFFWVFSLIAGTVHAYVLWKKTPFSRIVSESVISVMNVWVFVFTYFYFDLLHAGELAGMSGMSFQEKFSIVNFPMAFSEFLRNPTHLYLLSGSIILAIGSSLARSYIVHLQDEVTGLLGIYMDISVRDKILNAKAPELLSHKETVTILFSDIRGFTSLTERSSPEEVVAFLNEYFSLWSNVVKRHGGWIDKFIGDAVMAVFDGGTEKENAMAALACSEEIFRKLCHVKRGIFSDGAIGIGIDSGEVILGDIGSASRRNYTVIGDAVNTASRLEGLCKELWVVLVVSEAVYVLVREEFSLEPLGKVSIRGKRKKMPVYGRYEISESVQSTVRSMGKYEFSV